MAENGRSPSSTSPLVKTLATVGAGFLSWAAIAACFTPRQRYNLKERLDPKSDELLKFLEATAPSQVYRGNSVTVITDGREFYRAMVAAIRSAERTINLEAFVMNPGHIADEFIDALLARAQAGVRVSIVLDAFGAKKMFGKPLRRLKSGGCRVNFYQRAQWYSLARLNNRTHRELLIVDGRKAFTGGPGIADYWAKTDGGEPPWRDTAFQIEGPVVAGLQGVFAENWLESSSEILAGADYYPALDEAGSVAALVFKSSPADRSTVSRMLFHSLIACARESIQISTPYFIPDRGMRDALTQAARRGVQVDVLVPGGTHADQPLLRVASRHWFGELLKGGVHVHEYQASMIHQKLLLVDRWWVVMGTTNMDNRSFEHNDEVNVAFPDEGLARHMSELYARDLSQSTRVTFEELRDRSLAERAASHVAWVLDRQQ
ncbi:MAG: cardiolipin synthase [Acidobacteriota bacterium]|jgi:cardiolipin synthase